jgi:hypothetical protein
VPANSTAISDRHVASAKMAAPVAAVRVQLLGARISGTVDLSDAEVTSEVWIQGGRIEGDLMLAGSHWDRSLVLEGSTVTGRFFAPRMRSESDLLLGERTAILGDVDLGDDKIGRLEILMSTFDGAVYAQSLDVEDRLLMDHSTFSGGWT